MNDLIIRAKREKKWLWCRYQDLWFAPDELIAAQLAGRFRWGVGNWELRDPREKVAQLEEEVKRATATLENFKMQLEAGVEIK